MPKITKEEKEIERNKVKPVTFISGKYNYFHKHDSFKELKLLQAMRMTSDPKVLMQMTGIKKLADLSRTWDKISSRKEYNKALQELGMDFNWIAKGLKTEAISGEKSADRIKALQIILKSVGLDKYEDVPADNGSWEDMILKASESRDNPIQLGSSETTEYEVIQPVIPESAKTMREKEDKQGKSMYE
jgi:hypothetical protein